MSTLRHAAQLACLTVCSRLNPSMQCGLMNFEPYCTEAWKLSVIVGGAPSQSTMKDMEKNMMNRGTDEIVANTKCLSTSNHMKDDHLVTKP